MRPPPLFRAVFGLLALLLLAGPAGAGEPRTTGPLSAPVRAAVGELACARYGVAADSVEPVARQSGAGAASAHAVQVSVRCAAHASIDGQPARYQVDCRRDGERWRCGDGREVLSVQTRLGEVAVEPGSFTPEQAIRAVRAAAASNRYRAQIHEALASGCGLYVDVSAHMDEVVDLSCRSGHSFLISFWCPQGDCPRLLTVR
ncbi:hypothetical protein [Solimonas flava]|uniref:hypothetical protein n=1 Tax=Solimonas flava TaxID=415849 RepID=UPI0003FFEEF4|nr:hypothetical protein [Solimonas flava]